LRAGDRPIPQATPIATKTLPALPQSFFSRPAELVAPELIGCLLVKCQPNGELLWGVIVETEAYSQEDPTCRGYRRRITSNETLFGEPGRFYLNISAICREAIAEKLERLEAVK